MWDNRTVGNEITADKRTKALVTHKALTFVIVLLAGLGTATAVVCIAGRHDLPLWTFLTALIVFIAASVLMTKTVTKTPVTMGYLLDVGYGILAGLSFLFLTYAYDSIAWSPLLMLIWMFTMAICFTTYTDKRHPTPEEKDTPHER